MLTNQSTVTPWGVLAITSGAVFAVMLDALVLFVAFPSIQRSFVAVSGADLSWVLNAYTIVYGALLVPAGRVADMVGRKRMFLLGTLLFTLASALCGLAPTPTWLIAARMLQACGGAMLSPSALALTLAAFPQERRAIAVTIWAAVGALAVIAGPPVGAVIVQAVEWPGIFFLNLPIGLSTVITGQRMLRESQSDETLRAPDPLGVVLLIAGPALLAYGIVQSEAWDWSNPAVLSALAAGCAVLASFIVRSRRVAVPALDLDLFGNPNYRRANLATFIFSVAFTSMFLSGVFFLTQVWNFSLVQTGLAMMPGPLMVVLGAPFVGRVAARHGHRILLVPGGVLYASGTAVLLFGLSAVPHYRTIWLPATLLNGLGVALILPILSSAAMQELPSSKLAVGSAVNQAIRQFGTVLGVAMTLALLGPANTGALFRPVHVVMILCAVSVSMISLGIMTQRKYVPSDVVIRRNGERIR